MASGGLPVLPTFSVHTDPNTTSICWKKWMDKLENLFIALDIDSDKKQKATLFQETKSSIFITVSQTSRKELVPPLQWRLLIQYLISMKR